MAPCAGELEGPPDMGGCSQPRRAAVPRVTDHVARPFRSDRNLIHWNAFTQMRSAPPQPPVVIKNLKKFVGLQNTRTVQFRK
jgi:hypothetical protein